MKLVIDCFKLVKGAGKSIGIYVGDWSSDVCSSDLRMR